MSGSGQNIYPFHSRLRPKNTGSSRTYKWYFDQFSFGRFDCNNSTTALLNSFDYGTIWYWMLNDLTICGFELLSIFCNKLSILNLNEKNHNCTLRRFLKLILAEWRSQPMTKRLGEPQPITARPRSISLKPRLRGDRESFKWNTYFAHNNLLTINSL